VRTGFSDPMPSKPLDRRGRLALLVLAVSLVGCDHATKALAESSLAPLPGKVLPLAGHVVALRLAANPDTAFSLFGRLGVPHAPSFLLALAVAATILVGVTWALRARRGEARPIDHVGFALIVAGAVGNALDRGVRGYVVDFVQVAPWPIFNVADVLVVVGMALLALSAFRVTRKPLIE
jgi:signal peptidase II